MWSASKASALPRGNPLHQTSHPRQVMRYDQVRLQGYLAHKNPPTPQDHLSIGLLQSPRGRRFLIMSEVPLYAVVIPPPLLSEPNAECLHT